MEKINGKQVIKVLIDNRYLSSVVFLEVIAEEANKSNKTLKVHDNLGVSFDIYELETSAYYYRFFYGNGTKYEAEKAILCKIIQPDWLLVDSYIEDLFKSYSLSIKWSKTLGIPLAIVASSPFLDAENQELVEDEFKEALDNYDLMEKVAWIGATENFNNDFQHFMNSLDEAVPNALDYIAHDKQNNLPLEGAKILETLVYFPNKAEGREHTFQFGEEIELSIGGMTGKGTITESPRPDVEEKFDGGEITHNFIREVPIKINTPALKVRFSGDLFDIKVNGRTEAMGVIEKVHFD